jgi:hypothetical protein
MQDARSMLRQMGWILTGVGIADICYMIYSVISQIQHGSGAISYRSPFFIWPIVSGILLLQNRLTATRVISQLLAIAIGYTTILTLLTPFIQPLDLWLVSLKLYPQQILASLLWTLGGLVFYILVYLRITSTPIRNAMDEAQVNYVSFWRKPSNGLWVGACFALIVFLFIFGFLIKNPMAQKMKEKAAEQMGQGYKYFVSAMREHYGPGGHTVQGYVVAYNDKEIKNLPIEWTEKKAP